MVTNSPVPCVIRSSCAEQVALPTPLNLADSDCHHLQDTA